MNHNQQPAAPPRTVLDAVSLCAARFDEAGVFFGHGTDNAWDEAVLLVLRVLGLEDGPDVGAVAFPESRWAALDALVARRIGDRTPLPYLLGEAWFAGLRFSCDERALVPRSPLAELIEENYAPWYAGPPVARILDLCCGGGCIGVAAAVYAPQAEVTLADIDAQALTLARENIERHGVRERVKCIQSDLFEALGGERYDIILCNPPYVDSDDLAGMPAEFLREPERGLGAGADGLDIVRRILPALIDYLAPNGLCFLEVGNSWTALESAYPLFPFTWIELARGGHGIAAISAQDLRDHADSLAYNPDPENGRG